MTRAIEVDGLLIAHGSPDPRHAVALRRLAAQVADAVAPMACHIAFLDHDEPPLSDWIESRQHLRLRAIGLLLSSGYHARVDIPRALESATDVEDLGTLGSGEWLPPVLERNVADVGETPESPVVLVAAGSTEVSARADLVAASDLWQASRPGRVLT
ncbi:MAG TPA: CbiX/SirB N-terminal domain-containing protein, partial [Actinomycetes bacterium]|nr:CbiX/SirB N-terminal domain-containing protein [Actinomycetes bacterium]